MVDAASLPPRTAVVTGLGTTNPLAGDLPGTWRALHEHRTAVRALDEDWSREHALPVRVAAPLAVEPGERLTARETRRLDRASQCALLAAREAWQQAGGQALAARVGAERLAVSLSPGMGPVLSVMQAWDTLRQRGARRVLPTAVPALMPNAPAATSASSSVPGPGSTPRSRPAPPARRRSPTRRTSSPSTGRTSSSPGALTPPCTR